MQSPINSILRAATRKPGGKLNILTCPTHEAYESNLCKTGHNFYAVWTKGIKRWNPSFRAIPENYHLLPDNIVPDHITFDLVLSQQKFGQFQTLKPIADSLHVPVCSIEHTLPMPNWTEEQLKSLYAMRGDVNLFISEYSMGKWGWQKGEADVVHHGIDTDLFQPAPNPKPIILSVVNDWIGRRVICGFDTWQTVTKGLPVFVLGDTKGLSKPAANVEELAKAYQQSRIFLNTSLISPIPTALLEAMSAGCACVSTSNCMIPEIIEHGVNGFISNDERELRGYLELLLKDEAKAKELGDAARKTILDKFSLSSFVNNWDSYLRKTAEVVYKGER